MNEFDLIQTIVRRARAAQRPDSVIGVGDDAAVVEIPHGYQLLVSTDTLNVNRHFLPEVEPAALGHKALAVSLSDIAAMGATPAWALLNLTISHQHPNWVREFAEGFGNLARAYDVALIGGDTTNGPTAVAVTVMGLAPTGTAIQRGDAKPGQDVWVTGMLGDAALGLKAQQKGISLTEEQAAALHKPHPPVRFAQSLRAYASAAIDVSDGLLADLGHICKASGVSAILEYDAIPAHTDQARLASLDGGDEYQLCFVADPGYRAQVRQHASEYGVTVAKIGETGASQGAQAVQLTQSGQPMLMPKRTGYVHFSD